jgi:hypothetical protein
MNKTRSHLYIFYFFKSKQDHTYICFEFFEINLIYFIFTIEQDLQITRANKLYYVQRPLLYNIFLVLVPYNY